MDSHDFFPGVAIEASLCAYVGCFLALHAAPAEPIIHVAVTLLSAIARLYVEARRRKMGILALLLLLFGRNKQPNSNGSLSQDPYVPQGAPKPGAVDSRIAALGVTEKTALFAQAMLTQTGLVPISGLRTPEAQGKAMADRIYKGQRATWILGDSTHKATYVSSPISRDLNAYAVANYSTSDADTMGAQFSVIIRKFPPAQWQTLSDHMIGKALDYHYSLANVASVRRVAANFLPNKILTKEGGQNALHIQFA